MKEAYALGLNYAKNWNADAALVLMASVDNPNTDKDGFDGSRRYWNFEFAVPNTNNYYIITIHDGQMVNTTKTKGPNNIKELIYPEEVKIDSNKAVKMAQKDFGLTPGKGWAGGFHFTLNKIKNILTLTITGRDKSGFLSKISYNAETGELISAIHKIIKDGGIFKDFYRISSIDEHTAILGASISPNYSNDKTMVFWGYSDYMADNMRPATRITFNGGDSWADLNTNETIKQVYFSKSNSNSKKLYLLSNTDVFESDGISSNNKCIFHSPDEILASDYNDNTILILTTNKIIKLDLNNLKSTCIDAPQGTNIVSFVEKNVFILSNDKIYKFENEWKGFTAPIDKIVAIDASDGKLFCYSKESVGIYDSISNQWYVYDSPNEIDCIYMEHVKQNENISFYLGSGNGDLFKITKGGDSIEWVCEKVKRPEGGHLVALFPGSNELFYCIMPNVIWHDL